MCLKMFQAEIESGEDDGEVLAPEQHRARMFAKRTQSLSVFHIHTHTHFKKQRHKFVYVSRTIIMEVKSQF